jgi:hypothetical protein
VTKKPKRWVNMNILDEKICDVNINSNYDHTGKVIKVSRAQPNICSRMETANFYYKFESSGWIFCVFVR